MLPRVLRAMNSTQTCPNCPDGPVRSLFTLPPSVEVLVCQNCHLQFAAHYPEYTDADSEIYSYDYFSPAIEENVAHRERVFAELATEIESLVPSKGRLLDIGAGEGTLIKIASARGWSAEGTEISSAMVEHARHTHLTMHHGAIEDIPLPEGVFDVVVMNHVLEHVRNPRTTLQRIAQLLTTNGVVRIEVPNLASISSRIKNLQSRLRIKREPWKHYSTGHHFWFFTPATLTHTLQKTGFTVLRMESPAKQWGSKGPVDRVMNGLYRHTAWGGHIVVYARASQ